MRLCKYFIKNDDGQSNCVIRSFCKLFDMKYIDVYDELCNIANELGYVSFNEIFVFETFMKNHGVFAIQYGKDIMIKDLELQSGKYIIFCYDKKDYYHMVPIIDNVIYDRNDRCLNLYVITIYKEQ